MHVSSKVVPTVAGSKWPSGARELPRLETQVPRVVVLRSISSTAPETCLVSNDRRGWF